MTVVQGDAAGIIQPGGDCERHSVGAACGGSWDAGYRGDSAGGPDRRRAVQAQINLAGAWRSFRPCFTSRIEGYKLSGYGDYGQASLSSPGNQPKVTTTLSSTITFSYHGAALVISLPMRGRSV